MKLLFCFLVLLQLPNVWADKTTMGTKKQQKPKAKMDCICTMIYMPVCVDNKTYPSPCNAKCAGHEKWTDGPCATKSNPHPQMTPPPAPSK